MARKEWRSTARRNVAALSPEQAKKIIARVQAEGVTMFHKDIRDLTGGYNSQSINFHVLRLLGSKAGILKGPVS